MTYKEETYILNKLHDIFVETHENNIMLRQIIQYIKKVLAEKTNAEDDEFGRNVMANIVSEFMDNLKGKIKK